MGAVSSSAVESRLQRKVVVGVFQVNDLLLEAPERGRMQLGPVSSTTRHYVSS